MYDIKILKCKINNITHQKKSNLLYYLSESENQTNIRKTIRFASDGFKAKSLVTKQNQPRQRTLAEYLNQSVA